MEHIFKTHHWTWTWVGTLISSLLCFYLQIYCVISNSLRHVLSCACCRSISFAINSDEPCLVAAENKWILETNNPSALILKENPGNSQWEPVITVQSAHLKMLDHGISAPSKSGYDARPYICGSAPLLWTEVASHCCVQVHLRGLLWHHFTYSTETIKSSFVSVWLKLDKQLFMILFFSCLG